MSATTRTRRLGRGVLRTLALTLIAGFLGVLAVAVFIPRAGGATPYAVETGSMRPGLPPGTLVVTRPTDPEEIGVGSVVTYQLASGEATVVTHRVVATAVDGKGQLMFQTQGDANDVPDAAWVAPAQIRGTLWYSAPAIGRANMFLASWDRQLLTYVGAAVLAAYALALWGSAATRRLHPREVSTACRHRAAGSPQHGRAVTHAHAR